jgi:hypothetical protein
MPVRHLLHLIIGVAVFLRHAERREDRGLSQSAENAILLAGAVTIATIVITLLTVFVRKNMPK